MTVRRSGDPRSHKDELTKVFKGGTADVGPVERFYIPMVEKVQEVRQAHPGKGIVMSRAVFFRIERDVLRTLLGGLGPN